MPNAAFVGFTGTPLLKKDARTSLEVFGSYIHTYKFSEGVEDKVVLDLVYEARDIDQHLGSEDKIDAWFEAKTRGLNDWQKDELKKQWSTMQKVLSSTSRMDRVVKDIVFDFSVKPRLSSQRGNAILVASSIYQACKYFSLFQNTPFKGKCALVTSYNPQAGDVSLEETGENTETDKQFSYHTYTELLKNVDAKPGMTKTEAYEDSAKALFTREPANMRLLVVVDKLLTGFDAPPCTYLYIEKSMQDHGLFQAICRTNRLDGEDKDFGYIVDYKDLFKKVEKCDCGICRRVRPQRRRSRAGDPAAGPLDQGQGTPRQGHRDACLAMRASRTAQGRTGAHALFLRQYRDRFRPKGTGNRSAILSIRRLRRSSVHTRTSPTNWIRPAIAQPKSAASSRQLDHYLKVREIIRKASGETLDLKAYEADMRHLIDTYIEADEPQKISPFDNMGLLELIVKTGIADAINTHLGGPEGKQETPIAEAIENNIRRTILKEHLIDPAYYDKMSKLLDEIIADRKAKAIEYEQYLRHIAELAQNVEAGFAEEIPEQFKRSPALRALYNNLKKAAETPVRADRVAEASGEYTVSGDRVLNKAVEIDTAVKRVRPRRVARCPGPGASYKSCLV